MRFVRPSVWLAGAVGALVGFSALGGLTDVPLRWSDLGGWLDEVSVEDALVELARWLGMVLSAYVIVVSVLVLLGEVAATVRAVPIARLLRRVAGIVAVPALRRRLVEASTATAITVSAMSATAVGGAWAASPAVEQTVDVGAATDVLVLPTGVTGADVVGFGYGPQAAVSPAEVRVVVAPGDTVWDLATAHYGFCDQSVVDLVASASGLDDPDVIFAGQVLVLPPLPVPASVAAASDVAVVPVDAATWAVHTIVVGDTLWEILEGHYGFVTGDLVWSVAAYNGIDDPSDIPVGMPVTLPPLAVLTGDVPPTAAAPIPAPPVVVPPAPPVEAVPATPVDVAGSEVEAVPLPAAWPPPAPPAAAPTVPATPVDASPPSAPSTVAAAGSAGTDAGVPMAPWLVGLAGATTLSAGLLAVYRRLRRRQTSAGARAWRLMPSGESARLHRQLVAAADLPLVRWAGQEISGVLFGLGRPVAGPLAVELSDLTGVELLWDAPMPDAPSPWEATPAGWSWRLLYDPAAEVPDSELPAAIPGLVTLGRRDDAQVLVDLEAFGSVSIAGDGRAAEDVMRAVVLELGSGDELSDAWVSTVGLGVDGVEHLSRVQARSDAEALRHARGIVADERRVMADAGVEGTFVLRTSGAAANREVTVIAVRAESCEVLDELVALATPRSGLVLVVLGAVNGVGLRAVVDDGGAMDLEPLGMVLEAIGVSHEAASNTAVLLDAAAEHPTVEELDLVGEDPDGGPDETGEPDPAAMSAMSGRVVEEVAALCGPDGVDLVAAGDLLTGDDAPDEAWDRPTPALLVRVLGKPCLDPAPAELRRYERMVVVHVASSGGVASSGAIRDAVWGGALVTDKRFWNVVGHIRSQLGAEICPARATGPGSTLVRLEGASTDLELLESIAAHAERVPSTEALALLVEGLALVYGEPFDDVGYQWAIDQQLPFRAAKAIEAAALRAVELALAADDVVTARSAVSQALIGLPGNELLYRARMRIEAHAGNRAGIRSVYDELVSVLEDLGGDVPDAGDPSPATKQLFEQLVDGARQE